MMSGNSFGLFINFGNPRQSPSKYEVRSGKFHTKATEPVSG